MDTAEPLVSEPSSFKVEIAIEKLRRYKSLGTEQILAKLIQAGGNTLHSKIHKLITSVWNKEELPQQWKVFIIVPTYKKCYKTACSNYRGIPLSLTIHRTLYSILSSRLNPHVDEISGDHQREF
jgi:hypothetical protein